MKYRLVWNVVNEQGDVYELSCLFPVNEVDKAFALERAINLHEPGNAGVEIWDGITPDSRNLIEVNFRVPETPSSIVYDYA